MSSSLSRDSAALPSGRSSAPTDRISSGQCIVSSTSVPSKVRTVASRSLERIVTRATATRPVSSSARRRRVKGFAPTSAGSRKYVFSK